MNKLFRLFSVVLAVFVIHPASPGHAETIPAPRNIVLIYADDLGYGDLASYGATKIKTPEMDRLTAGGIRFTDAHSPAAVCSPSRYTMLTGRYCWRTSLTNRVLAPQAPMHVETDRLTLPAYLQSKGYTTGIVGKWHLGLGEPPETDWNSEPISPSPNDVGFDYSYIIPGSNNFPPSVYIENGRVQGRQRGEVIELSVRPDGKGTPGWKLHEKQTIKNTWKADEMGLVLAEKGVEFIEEHADEPFFLYFPTPHPHLPLTPNARFKGSSQAGTYGDFVQELDWMVGRLIETLEKHELLEETLIILSSDNGGVTPLGTKHEHRINGELRGRKGQIYEGGHRVPFIVHWPQVVDAAQVSDALLCQVDLFASIHALFGDRMPEGAGEDSWNRLDVLLGGEEPLIGRPMVHHSSLGMFALRIGPWKYIQGQGPGGSYSVKEFNRFKNDPKWQLYNLQDDQLERNNLYLTHPEIVSQMDDALEKIKAQGHNRDLIQSPELTDCECPEDIEMGDPTHDT